MKSKPFFPFLVGAVLNIHSGFFFGSLLDLRLCPCQEKDAQCQFWKWRECLSHPGRGTAEGCPHPTSLLMPKGLTMSAGQFKCRI